MSLPLKSRIYYGIGKYLPFLKIGPPQVDRQMVMRLRPLRNGQLAWEKRDSGETLLTVPQSAKAGRVTQAMARWLRVPKERHVELDEVGSFVWEQCDGDHTVESIVQQTGRHYKMNRREAEVSVTMFLQMLHERHFIAFYKVSKSKKSVDKLVEKFSEEIRER